MAGAIDNKFHCKIDTSGFILDRGQKAIYAYQKKRAPQWVNRTGSGDSTYRDSTFWQYWAQINWRNGCKQEKFGDGGKFWKSNGIATSQMEQISLAKALVSAGQVESGAKINCMAAWRGSQSWWSGSYVYRQQLTITAGSVSIPAGYPIKVTVDSAALETAGKVRSDRKDWRIIYWNGTAWTDLSRDYISASVTYFAVQTAITAGATDANYYLYYGNSGESTNKQPTDDATWTGVYGNYGITPDSNTVGMWIYDNGTGSTVTDRKGSADLSISGMTWSLDGYYGRCGTYTTNSYARYADSGGTFNLGSQTIEAYITTGASLGGQICARVNSSDAESFIFSISSSKLHYAVRGSSGNKFEFSGNTVLSTNTSYHVAATYDGASTMKVFLNGVQDGTYTLSDGAAASISSSILHTGKKDTGGADSFYGKISLLRISNFARTSFPYATPGILSPSAGTETITQPPASNFTLYAGTDTGKIYSWDGSTTWTLAKDCNLLADGGATTDTTYRCGDVSGVEKKVGQSFSVAAAVNIKEVKIYAKATDTDPSGAITVRLETNNAGAPSGSLINSDATGTIANFTETSNAWKTCTLATAVPLVASTTYWVVLSAAAQSNDVGWDIAANTANPYASGVASTYTPSAWTEQTGKDICFQIESTTTSVNTMLVSSLGGTQNLIAGTGAPSSQVNGDARLVTYNGTTWAMGKQFNAATDSQVLSLAEYSAKMYAGVGPQARIYETSDFSTWTLSKDIDFPQKPGYPYVIKEYNSQLIASGGSPEFMVDSYYNGFSFVYNGTLWQSLYPFDHTIVKCSEFYDSFLFIGTYHGQIYTYNTSFLDPLFSFKDDYDWNVVISSMKYFDDKLFLGLRAQDGLTETNTGLWLFDRHGLTQQSTIPNSAGVYSLEQVNNVLMVGTSDGYVYKQDPAVYQSTGWLQTSYFDANLPTVPKLWNSIQINYDPLLAGHSIAAAYRYKETDAWTSLTPSVAQTVGGTSTTWTFPAGTNSKKISVLITLSTTNTATTPVMREFILQYCLFPVVKWQWNLRLKTKSPLKLADDSIDTRSAETMRTELEALLSDTKLHTFTDIDGSTHTVLFYNLDETSWVINQEDTSGSSIPITLIEV